MARGPTAAAELNRLRGDLDLDTPAPVLLFHGEESYYRELASTVAQDRLLKDSLRDFNLDRRDGMTTGPGEWVALASNRPMLGDRRVIVVTGAERWLKVGGLKADEKVLQNKLADFADAESSPGTIILLAATADRRSRLWKTLHKRRCAYEFAAMQNIEEAETFLQDRFRANDIRVERSACRYLAEALGTAISDLITEVRRLILFLGDRKELTLADVEGQVSRTRTHTVFEFVDALGRRDAHRALGILDRLLEGGVKSDRKTDVQAIPLILVALLHRQVRNMILALSLEKDHGMAPGEFAQEMGVPPFVAQKIVRQAHRFSAPQLQRTLDELASVDRRLKSTALPARALMEGLVFQVCAAPPTGGRRAP